MKEKLTLYKKKIIITISTIVVIALAATGIFAGTAYKYAKDNTNFSEKQAKEIATQHVKGEVASVHKEFELDEKISKAEYQYEIEIKTPDNLLKEVTVSSKTGTIEIDD